LDPVSDAAHIIRATLVDANPVFGVIFAAPEMQLRAQKASRAKRGVEAFLGSAAGSAFSGGSGGAPP
jgi:hypothetical protein